MSTKPESGRPGRRISRVEVISVSAEGLRLLLDTPEVFVPFQLFPWFKAAPVDEVFEVTLPSPGHLRWESLDIDIAVESLDHPERYPLVSKLGKARAALVKDRRRRARPR